MREPLNPDDFRQAMREVLERGDLQLSKHARDQMAQREIDMGDVLNVLRAGWMNSCDLINQSWRYRVITMKGFEVVVAFRSESVAVVVTAWKS